MAATVADADALPFGDGTVNGVWCRDMLEMVDDPVVTLQECSRVLREGAGMLLYVPFMTERMEPLERAELLSVSSAEWWGLGRQPIEEAIERAGFDVLSFKVTSPDYTESRLLEDPQKVVDQLIEHAQLRRGKDIIEPMVGAEWYQRFLAWSRWQAYLLLGKLENGLWLLQKRHHRSGELLG
jgi:SAM-dependent methyltransferase